MSQTFTLRTVLDRPFQDALAATRDALARHGFGIITEIDMSATLKTKLGVDVDPQVILGACRPELAYEAIRTTPSVAAVLPCNVVVRSLDGASTLVEAFDPGMMVRVAGDDALGEVAADARRRLLATLQTLNEEV